MPDIAPTPATPVSAPAKPAVPASAPKPAPGPVPDTTFNDEIDQMAGNPPAPKPKVKAPDKPVPTPKPKAVDKQEGVEKVDQGEQKKETPDESVEKSGEPAEDEWDVEEPTTKTAEGKLDKAAPAELRKAYDETKKRVQQLETELQTLKSKPADDPEKKQLKELLTKREERLQQLEDEMKLIAFEKSSEYNEKYNAPMVRAFQQGESKAKSLKVTDPATGELRQGTEDDFRAVMRANTDEAAAELATELFGTKASLVLYQRERVMELNQARLDAVDQYRKTAKERDEKTQAERVKQEEAMTTQAKARVELFMKTRDDAIEKYGHLFKPVEGDEKGNELLQRGFDRVDLVFGKKPQKPLTPEQATKLHAMIRNKAGAFDRLNHLHRQAKARINELEAELQQFRDSSPSGGLERRGAKEEGMPSFEQEIDRIASGR